MAEINLKEVQQGDVVQIDPESHARFAACLMVVTDVKNWGLQGYIIVPGVTGSDRAYYRVNNGGYAKVGVAKWLRGDEAADKWLREGNSDG